jgi:hypothetical protein
LQNGSCGNFYWQGHGGPQSIGVSTNPVATDHLTVAEVNRLLGNQGYLGTNTFANNHPYRLVILDGCETWSWDWAKAWGIPWFSEDIKANHTSRGLDVCAYVGWTKTVWTFRSNNGGEAYGRCLSALFSAWYSGYPLKQCLTAYNQQLTNDLNKPYLPANNNFNSWKIAGCADLTIQDR